MREQEDELANNETNNKLNDNVNIANNDNNKNELWFIKILPFIVHFRHVSMSLIFILGTFLAIDEMMIRFRGRSSQTHRMKNKPIKEGYKFFVLSTVKGFIVNFTPDGTSTGQNEYVLDKSVGKIQSMMEHLIQTIFELKEKQHIRLKIGYKFVSTRTNKEDFFAEHDQKSLLLLWITILHFQKL